MSFTNDDKNYILDTLKSLKQNGNNAKEIFQRLSVIETEIKGIKYAIENLSCLNNEKKIDDIDNKVNDNQLYVERIKTNIQKIKYSFLVSVFSILFSLTTIIVLMLQFWKR